MRARLAALVVALAMMWGAPAHGQIGIHGVIVGTVQVSDGALAPGATVTLTGDALIQKSLVQETDSAGQFRFYNLIPGEYVVTVVLSGFETVQITATVSVGKTTTVQAKLPMGRVTQEVIVQGQAPVIDKTEPGQTTNFTAAELRQLPNTRNFMEVMETAPAINNRAAFGAGGNVEDYDAFGWGAATNSYQVNGVQVNNLEFGNTWVNPNYDTIEEIQVVGPGASAEYSNFTGASVNVVTKAGTNEYRGGASVWYTSDDLKGDNSDEVPDYWPDQTKYSYETSVFLGGPLVRERLLFFGSVAYLPSSTAPHEDPTAPEGTPSFYDKQRRKTYQVRLDFLANANHRLTGMYDREPIRDDDLGLLPGAGSEIGYYRDWLTNTEFLSWQAVWNQRTLSELKWAGVSGHNYRIPNAPMDVPGVSDYRRGERRYGSAGFRRDQENRRQQLVASVTHYTDAFLGARHAFKAGTDYEHATTLTDFKTSGNAILYLFPYGPGMTYLSAITGYNTHQRTKLQRVGAYVQDKLTVKDRTTVTVGVRYDGPRYRDQNNDKVLMKFDNVALRTGVSHDLTGDGRTVLRAAWGRYYEKVPTYGPGYYAGTGNEPITYYVTLTDQPVDPTDWRSLAALVIQPSNIAGIFETTQLPVDPALKNPKTDVLNVGFEKQVGDRVSLSASYIHKRNGDFISLGTYGDLEFTPMTYTQAFNNQTITMYNWTNRSVPRDDHLTNLDYFYSRNHLAIGEVRSRPWSRLALNGSLTWERGTGTRENNECGVLGLCTNGYDKDPNRQSPWNEGVLPMTNTWQVKVNGNLDLPAGISASWDYRWLTGHPWGAVVAGYRIPGFNDGRYTSINWPIEPKDARRMEATEMLNLRVGKEFRFGRTRATALVDVLNALNNAASADTYYYSDINAVYTYTFDADGNNAKAFGKPSSLIAPRAARIGLRLTF